MARGDSPRASGKKKALRPLRQEGFSYAGPEGKTGGEIRLRVFAAAGCEIFGSEVGAVGRERGNRADFAGEAFAHQRGARARLGADADRARADEGAAADDFLAALNRLRSLLGCQGSESLR